MPRERVHPRKWRRAAERRALRAFDGVRTSMRHFPCAHATHPQWQGAATLVLAQLRGMLGQSTGENPQSAPGLALLYITDHYATEAADILDYLGAELPWVTDWSGTVGVGIAGSGVEYFDEPAMAVMLLDIPADRYRVFSGIAPLSLGFQAHTALVHADGATPDLQDLIAEMAARTDAGYIFGGLSASRSRNVQFARAGDGTLRGHGKASGVFSGGLSGVCFNADVSLMSRVTQGCVPVAQPHMVGSIDHNVVLELDGRPALDVLLSDLRLNVDDLHGALDVVRATLVGLAPPPDPVHSLTQRTGNFGADVTVRHIVGLDPVRRGIAIAQRLDPGLQLTFCRRNVQAARADLTRICAEIREELESMETPVDMLRGQSNASVEVPVMPAAERICGAVYISCSGRGGAHFGGPSAELQLVRKALGDVPLIGFFAGGEIAYSHLYGYTGVLTVFLN